MGSGSWSKTAHYGGQLDRLHIFSSLPSKFLAVKCTYMLDRLRMLNSYLYSFNLKGSWGSLAHTETCDATQANVGGLPVFSFHPSRSNIENK